MGCGADEGGGGDARDACTAGHSQGAALSLGKKRSGR